MTCAVCGTELREGSKFCAECGTPTSRACPNCSTPVSPTDKFCAECGTPLVGRPSPTPAPAAATPAPAEPSEERRFVTALFIDIVGFTPLTEQRDSEEVRHMLTVYFDRAREIVERFGGVIDKYIGDAVMAVWGAHVAHEDDAERAVRAGIELVDAVEELGGELELPDLRARAGVLSGEAAVGGDGNAVTGLIIGDTVNIASRLQSAAEPGAVLVGRATKELSSGAIEYAAAGSIELKGKSEPVEAWRAIRVVGGQRGTRRADGLVPPFVGRTDELRLLKDNLHAAGREQRLRMVSIVGQGGIGKSRLIDELWNYVDGLTDDVYWHHGRSPAYGEGLSFWALGEMIRQRCGIAETDDDHRTRTRLRTTLAEYVPDADDRAWMEPRLEALLGLADVPSDDRAELFAAWRMLFLRIAERGTVVMVFEDLHWADDGVLDFIEEMLSIGTDVPVVLVTLARSEILDRRPGWGSGRANSVAVHLAPLAPPTMQELVAGVVTDAPRTLIDRLVEQAGGVPLYAVELLRMLLARDLIAPDGQGRHRMAGDVTAVDIPDSLHGLVGARIDQFDPAIRSLIADAAILGQSFTVDGLVALRGQSTDEITRDLEPLVRREVLSVNRDPRSPERGQYRFVQSIIREVAHQRINRAERLAGHVKVAAYFESFDDPELAGIVASHYLDAVEAAPEGDQRNQMRSRAIAALLAAADRAGALQSHAQVVRLCQRGIELSDEPADRGELLIRAAWAADSALDDRAESFARDAIQAFGDAEDSRGRLRATHALARLLDNQGRSNEAWPMLLEAVGENDDRIEIHDAEAVAELARAYMLDRHDEEAARWADRALALAEQLDAIPIFAEALTTRGAALAAAGRSREGMILQEAAVTLARKHQLSATKRRAMTNLAYVSGSDTWDGRSSVAEQLEDARRTGEPRQLTEALLGAAWTHLWWGEWDELDQILRDIDPDSLPAGVVDTYWEMVTMRMALSGRAEEAAEQNAARLAEREGVGDSQTSGVAQIDLVGDAFWAGRFEEACDLAAAVTHHTPYQIENFYWLFAALRTGQEARLREVAAAIEATPFKGRVTDCFRHVAAAAAAAHDGRMEEATDRWGQALTLADDVWMALLRHTLAAEAAASLGPDHPLVRDRVRAAYETYTSIGADTFLDLWSDVLNPADEEAREAGTA